MIFRDITERRRSERVIDAAREYAESIVATVREPLLVLNADLHVRSANRSFYETFQVKPPETEDRSVYELGDGQWDIPALRTLLEEIIPHNSSSKISRWSTTSSTSARGRCSSTPAAFRPTAGLS